MPRRSFLMLIRNAEAEVAAMVEPVESVSVSPLTPDDSSVYLCIPGDRFDVEARLEGAVTAWLEATPPMRQSASSLSRHLMRTLERVEDDRGDGNGRAD